MWEIKQKVVLDLAAGRGGFICQSQSMNVHIAEPSVSKLISMHLYAWKRGLKTGMFYLRSRPKAIQFTVDHAAIKKNQAMSATMTGKSVAEPEEEECLSCGA